MKDKFEIIIFIVLLSLLTIMSVYTQSNINDLTDQIESLSEQINYIEGAIE